MLIKLLLLIFFFLSCQKENNKFVITTIPEPLSGISGIQKIDDFPFYIMNYSDDYHFDDYLATGTYPVFVQNSTMDVISTPWGCSGFAALGQSTSSLFGRNFDWNDCIPLLLITKPTNGYSSVSMVDLEFIGFTRNNLPDNPQTNQRLLSSPYLPFDGMNEKGVAMGMMAIQSASCYEYPLKKTIEELEVIRLVLDYAASVDEAIRLINNYNVSFTHQKIHYMIADRSGKSAIVEFVNGEMKVITNSEPWQVCTNFIITGSNAPNNVDCWRYNKAYIDLKGRNGVLDLNGGLKLTEGVSQSNTIWSMVYDMQNYKVFVSIARNYSKWMQYSFKP